MAGTEIKRYAVFFYGGKEGYQNARAQIQLFNEDDKLCGLVKFYDDTMQKTDDAIINDVIYMYQPYATFQSVIDTIRNEKPILIDFRMDRGFLMTSNEPIGEGE